MNENRKSDMERVVERDLHAYRSVTERELPSLDDTARLLRARAAGPRPRESEEGFWMKNRRFLHARPGLTLAAALVVVALVLGIVPISYERTTGHDVALTLAGTSLDAQTVTKIASQFKGALGAENVRIAMTGAEGAGTTDIVGRVDGRRGAAVERTARAFASALGSKGIASRVEVTPVKERVSSNVYALAMSRAIELRIDRAGRTPAQMEADIRAQLEAAGIENPTVSVTQAGDQTSVKVVAKSSSPADGEREINLQLNAGGSAPLDAKLQRFEVKRTPGMTDADVKAEVERQMREAGVEGEVTVENGEVRVKVEQHEQKQP
jgi:hypothetical protein